MGGSAEVCSRFGRTMEWGTPASQAVLEAAGGKVLVAKTGEKLAYGKPEFENRGLLAVSERKVIHGKAKQPQWYLSH